MTSTRYYSAIFICMISLFIWLQHAVSAGATEAKPGDTLVVAGDCSSCDRLISFTAQPSYTSNSILIEWETASETHILGYHIWRSDSEYGVYKRITDVMAPSSGEEWGGSYVYEDEEIVTGTGYYYKLLEIEEDEDQTFYGPISSDGMISWDDWCADDDCHDDDHHVIIHCFISALWD